MGALIVKVDQTGPGRVEATIIPIAMRPFCKNSSARSVSSDYEQVKSSQLEVGFQEIILRLQLHPWEIVETLRRVEASHERGFYRASDVEV